MPWPYDRDALFRDPDPSRPVSQGDIFQDVPIIKARAGDRPPESDPKLSIDRRPAILIGYPCDIYDHGRLLKVQTVAVVRLASKLGVPDDWDGAFNACPLPEPMGDGQLWAADFQTISPVDRSYLSTEQRIAIMSELGLAHLRQRIALYATRLRLPLATLLTAGKAIWDEIELWEDWVRSGSPADEFQDWLDSFDTTLGRTRREALEAGERAALRAAIDGQAA